MKIIQHYHRKHVESWRLPVANLELELVNYPPSNLYVIIQKEIQRVGGVDKYQFVASSQEEAIIITQQEIDKGTFDPKPRYWERCYG